MSHEQYTPIGKLSEQPPPFEFTSGSTRIGGIDPLGAAARLRILALKAAKTVLGDDVPPQELIVAAHYIVTGELIEEGDDDEEE